jgi:diadenosine tetraphosphate (Ap4A) HIT family hydrolase
MSALNDDWMRDRIGAAQRGENPLVIARMRSGFAVIGDVQFMPGYCVLLASPQVDHLSDLPLPARTTYLADMSLLGEAILRVVQPRRMNYEILGNTDAYLHAHVWPRYDWEPQEYRGGPVWRYPREQRLAAEHAYSDARHGDLRRRIGEALQALLVANDAAPPAEDAR